MFPLPKGGLLDRICSIRIIRPVLKALYTHRELPAVLWSYLNSRRAGNGQRELFDAVETCCVFSGYARSGGTLLGSLLDAHPDMVISHELDAFRLLHYGFSRDQIYRLILKRDELFTSRGRKWMGYGYDVPNQWQGRFRKLRVIGDKKAACTTKRLEKYPELIQRLRETVGTRVRFIHLVRNPYDNITTLWKKRAGVDMAGSVEYYFYLAGINAGLRKHLADDELIELRHESLVADPRGNLARLCEFLGVECPEAYLDDCASIVFESPRKTRFTVEWSDELIREVASRMEPFEFLRGYSYDEG